MARSINLKEESIDKIAIFFFEVEDRVFFCVSIKNSAYVIPVTSPVIIDIRYV